MLADVDQPGSGLTEIASSWHDRLRPAVLRVVSCVGVAAVLGSLLLARVGTATTRLVAGGGLFAAMALWFGFKLLQHRRAKQTARRAVEAVRRVDRKLADALSRSIGLVEDVEARAPAISLELANLHLRRIVAHVPLATLEERATRAASRWSNLAAVLGVVLLGLAWGSKRSLVEGANVLLSIHGQAPFEQSLLELDLVTVQPPTYLQQQPDLIEFSGAATAPRGSQVTVRGIPRQVLSKLVLTDGNREIPFVADGNGAVAAQYRLLETARLRVAARFGDTLIRQHSELALEAIPDPAPVVELEGAPKSVAWAEANEFELHYRASDDHGLREIDLVLRTAGREERRVLVRLDGTTKFHTGAQVLLATDAFVSGAYGSVEVSIAARDDNSFDASSWGQSAVIRLDKPAPGNVEARRRDAFLRLREDLTRWLAEGLNQAATGASRLEARSRVFARLDQVEAATQSDTTVNQVMRTFLRAERDKLIHASKDPSKLLPTLEEVTLALDVALDAVAQRDAEHVAQLLAEVATEIEMGAKDALLAERREQGHQRILAARDMLSAGARELHKLGLLGGDLGEIALAGAARIRRAHEANDWENVGRAASFLAERLRRPVPSFKGGGGRAGVESSRPASGQSRPRPSEADTRLERVINELLQLARDHATEIESVERLTRESDSVTGSAELMPEAKQRAARLRGIVEPLPPLGAEPGSQRAALALAKELVVGAAESLERLHLSGAYENLKRADSALAEAELLRGQAGSSELRAGSHESSQSIRRELSEQLQWIKQVLDTARAKGSAELNEALDRVAGRERELAVRAEELARRETKKDAVLPDEIRSDLSQASRLMQKAAAALEAGRGRGALEPQKQAQELLERNQPIPDKPRGAAQQEHDDSSRGNPDRAAKGGNVVSTSDVENRERFRRRVQDGLSQEVSPDLSKAVRRYAEGLLK